MHKIHVYKMFIVALFTWWKNLQDIFHSEIIRTQNIATENINQIYKNPYYLIEYLNSNITHKHTCVNSTEKYLGEIHIDLLRLVGFDEKMEFGEFGKGNFIIYITWLWIIWIVL